jgi:hypothetical protein
MLPFLGILIAIAAMVGMAYSTRPDNLYRFTSTEYGDNKRAIFEIRSNSFEEAEETGRRTLAIYKNDLGTKVDLRWELIEELDPKTNKVLTVLYKLPELEKVK